MAVQDPGIDIGYVLANVDLSGSQFCGVRSGTADFNVVLANLAATPVLGILQNKPLAGQAADVRVFGASKAKAGASYALGAALSVDSTGRVITAVSGQTVIAYALEAATAANEIRSVLVTGGANFKLP